MGIRWHNLNRIGVKFLSATSMNYTSKLNPKKIWMNSLGIVSMIWGEMLGKKASR